VKARIDDVQLAYTDEGNGIPIVFVHAFPFGKAMWEPQVKDLSKQFRVIAADLRGHGESDAGYPPGGCGRYTMEQFADDLKGLLDHLSLPQAVMAGLSMGGYILFAFYRKYAERVRALILADTRAQADTQEGKAGRIAMAQLLYKEGAPAIADAMMPKLLSPAALQGRLDLVQRVRDIITGNQLSGIAGDLMAMRDRPDSVALLKQITCPTLVIVGEQDIGTPPSDARLMADNIPGARLEIIPGAGHMSNLEQPDAFNRAIRSFLASL